MPFSDSHEDGHRKTDSWLDKSINIATDLRCPSFQSLGWLTTLQIFWLEELSIKSLLQGSFCHLECVSFVFTACLSLSFCFIVVLPSKK